MTVEVIAGLVTVTFSCNEGFQMQGNQTRTCGADMEWTGEETKCTVVPTTGPTRPVATPDGSGTTAGIRATVPGNTACSILTEIQLLLLFYVLKTW